MSKRHHYTHLPNIDIKSYLERDTQRYRSPLAVSRTQSYGRRWAAASYGLMPSADKYGDIGPVPVGPLVEPLPWRRQTARPTVAPSAKPAGADRRRFHPGGAYTWPVNASGTNAHISPRVHAGTRTMRQFAYPSSVVDCVKRYVRREVIFALKKNRGHHTPKRRSDLSEIGC